MNFVYCEHISSYKDVDPYAISPQNQGYPFRFALGVDNMLVLCSKCEKALAYEMITMFNRDSQHKVYPQFYRRY